MIKKKNANFTKFLFEFTGNNFLSSFLSLSEV